MGRLYYDCWLLEVKGGHGDSWLNEVTVNLQSHESPPPPPHPTPSKNK